MDEKSAAKARTDLQAWLAGGELPPVAFLTGVTGMVVIKSSASSAAAEPGEPGEPGRCGECGGAKCQKYRSTCANDHCLECGAAT